VARKKMKNKPNKNNFFFFKKFLFLFGLLGVNQNNFFLQGVN